jgi:hypothetical protein
MHIALVFKGFSCDPRVISSILGLTADLAYMAGESTPNGRIVRYNYWHYSLYESQSEVNLSGRIKEAVILLSSRMKEFRDLRNPRFGERYISAGLTMHGRSPIMYFEEETLRLISDMGLAIDIDLNA